MIPSDFKYFFVNSGNSEQQSIVSLLMDFSFSNESISDVTHGRLKGVQHYRCKGCLKNFSHTSLTIAETFYTAKKTQRLNENTSHSRLAFRT